MPMTMMSTTTTMMLLMRLKRVLNYDDEDRLYDRGDDSVDGVVVLIMAMRSLLKNDEEDDNMNDVGEEEGRESSI
eukprot:6626840-Pyramimonas_sp.AAC.1